MASRNASPSPSSSIHSTASSRMAACNAGTCGCHTCAVYFAQAQTDIAVPQGAVCVSCVRRPTAPAASPVASSAASSIGAASSASGHGAAASTQSMRYKDLSFRKRFGVALSLMSGA